MKWFTRYSWLLLGFSLSLIESGSGASAGPGKTNGRPNVLFILTDDQRWDALGCMGNPIIQTPNIDRLAAAGTRFKNNFVTTSICCVSRASFFTGQYERRHGITNFTKPFSPGQWAQTYPAVFRANGYRTGFFGKFGVGSSLPTNQFDVWGGFGGQGTFFGKGDPEHQTAKLGRQAVEFLKANPTNQPFCLSISFNAPHARDGQPREFPPDARDEALYTGALVPVPKTATEAFFEQQPDFIRDSEGHKRWQARFANPELFQKTVRDYYRLITGIDREVGALLTALKDLQLDENTLIVFTSDNGFFYGERGLADKWLMYEESIRVPLIIRPPPAFKSAFARTVPQMTLNVDLAPTLLDYAGLAVPAGMQGRSLRPLVEKKSVAWRSDWFYEHHFTNGRIPPSEGVRGERWKYIRYVAQMPVVEELYDLSRDPLEEHNLAGAGQHKAVLERLRLRWAELQKQAE
jgi:arylsulfatase A-like enzyme